ncbi:hypothetical protein [Endozoicomonas sp. ONNA1]|uniref:hypothetical protein n=1 Tax=Endozoicomonas sp. ONNA1 TaxID=2828740 RepID=UPI0021496BAE|nr:hypothetical protein [Endozoicomonas sp. ONNA1]
METVNSLFKIITKDVSVNKELVQSVKKFVRTLINRNAESIAFFGDALLGVYPIRFTREDRELWFDEILNIDELELDRGVKSLPNIDNAFKVSSDSVNLSVIWLVHAAQHSKLSSKDKVNLQTDALFLLHYKFLSSLQTHYFRYPADKSVALATYASLSKKFAIKVYGSWFKLIHARCEEVLSSRSIHRKTIEHLGPDDRVVYMVNDIQSRIREVVKKLATEFYKVRDQDKAILTSSKLFQVEGETLIRDTTHQFSKYRTYIHGIVSDRRSFIRDDLVAIITKIMYRMPERFFREGLEYLSDNYGSAREKRIEQSITDVVIHAFTFAQSEGLKLNQLATILTKLRSLYMASRTSDPELIKIREQLEAIVKDAISSRNISIHSSVRTAVALYIVLRTLAMHMYR